MLIVLALSTMAVVTVLAQSTDLAAFLEGFGDRVCSWQKKGGHTQIPEHTGQIIKGCLEGLDNGLSHC